MDKKLYDELLRISRYNKLQPDHKYGSILNYLKYKYGKQAAITGVVSTLNFDDDKRREIIAQAEYKIARITQLIKAILKTTVGLLFILLSWSLLHIDQITENHIYLILIMLVLIIGSILALLGIYQLLKIVFKSNKAYCL